MKFSRIYKERDAIIGSKLGFEAQEAYNLLRTNMMLSFSDEKKCRVIGITSAMHGDGKSITAINTAYSLVLAGQKVLLIEGDLRLPAISTAVGVKQIPGLSNYLTGQCQLQDTIRKNTLIQNLDVASAGDIPPNPSELSGSEKMKKYIEEMSLNYEYILIDLPPVSAVSDAIVLSAEFDGMLVVVRHNYTDGTSLLKMMRQFEYAEVKVLGFVLNDFERQNAGYYKHYKKYYGKNAKYYKNAESSKHNTQTEDENK